MLKKSYAVEDVPLEACHVLLQLLVLEAEADADGLADPHSLKWHVFARQLHNSIVTAQKLAHSALDLYYAEAVFVAFG